MFTDLEGRSRPGPGLLTEISNAEILFSLCDMGHVFVVTGILSAPFHVMDDRLHMHMALRPNFEIIYRILMTLRFNAGPREVSIDTLLGRQTSKWVYRDSISVVHGYV